MGLYLRKGFRAGPVRFNLSKSGLGISAGVKGARFGVGPSGTYVHAGRQGLYYRQYLPSGGSRTSQSNAGPEGLVKFVLAVFAIVFGVWLLLWLTENPVVIVVGIMVALGLLAVRWLVRFQRKKFVSEYNKSLDSIFVMSKSPPSVSALASLSQLQMKLPKSENIMREIEQIETDVYQAILDKVLDDGFITEDESSTICAAEQALRISPELRSKTKKDIFSAAYLEAIQDREITKDELDTLSNLISGLGIPQNEVQHELKIVHEIIDTQELSLPLEPIPFDKLAVRTQKNEKAYYQCSARVLKRKKSKTSLSGYEYTVQRDGTMVVTDNRIFVVGEGTTNIRYTDIADLDVDIDEGIIEISKTTSSQPVFLKTDAPIYTARLIDLLLGNYLVERSA